MVAQATGAGSGCTLRAYEGLQRDVPHAAVGGHAQRCSGGGGDGGDDVSRPTHTGFGFEGGDDTSSLKRRRVTTSGGGGDSSFRSTTPALMRTAPRLRGVAANEVMTPGGNSGAEPGRRPVCNSVNAPGSAVAPFSLESVDTPRAKRRTSPYMRYCAAQRKELLGGDPALTFGQISSALSSRWRTMSDDERAQYTL
mmetsp:Transcript_24749/g.61710  ORF Transcript_24749/g.61710 Transcript_24749/m.61710 type:complete len:196 (+) Transcript_24749:1016-1603(+)